MTNASSLLQNWGLKPIKTLSTKNLVSSTYLCTEEATQRLLVAKLWNSECAPAFRREIMASEVLSNKGLAPDLLLASRMGDGFLMIRRYLVSPSVLDHNWTEESFQRFKDSLLSLIRRVHSQNWIHRDLTPTNVLWDGSQAFIIDWDLAECLSSINLDSLDSTLGTAGFSLSRNDIDLFEQDLQACSRVFDSIEQRFMRQPKEKKWFQGLF